MVGGGDGCLGGVHVIQPPSTLLWVVRPTWPCVSIHWADLSLFSKCGFIRVTRLTETN